MPKRSCHLFHANFIVALILRWNVAIAHLGGGAVASRSSMEIKAGGTVKLLDPADNGSHTGGKLLMNDQERLQEWAVLDNGSTAHQYMWGNWYDFHWGHMKEIDEITTLLAVDGGGTQTKVIYEPCEDHAILDMCCTTVDKEMLLKRLSSSGFSIPDGKRIPMTGGLAVRLQNPGNPLRQYIQRQDEVRSLAAGILPFMEADGLRSFTSWQEAFVRQRRQRQSDFRKNRFIYVDLSDQKPFITEVNLNLTEDHRFADLVMSAKTLSRKGIDGTSFQRYFKEVAGHHLKDAGIETNQVLEAALERVKKRLDLEDADGKHTPQDDTNIEEEIDKLRDLHSGFHVRVEDIYPDGYAGLHPLVSAAFMAKVVIPNNNGTAANVFEFATNFAMGYLEMVAQNAVSLAKNYQLLVGAGQVVFGGQLLSSDNVRGEICKLFIAKYIKKLFRTSPNKAQIPGPDQKLSKNLEKHLVMPSPDHIADDGVSVWLYEDYVRGSVFEYVKYAARAKGKGREGLGERPDEFYEKKAKSCCARHPRKSFILASVGTGSPIAKVTVSDTFEIVDLQKIGGSAIGGGTSAGLLKALQASKPLDDGDIPVSFDDEVQRPLTLQAYNVIGMISKSIAEIVSLAAVLNDCSTVVFTGGFLQNNIDAETFITNVCLEFGLEVLFQKPDRRSFTAVIGAHRLSGKPDASDCLPMRDAEQQSTAESMGVRFMVSMLILVVMAFSLDL